MLLTDFKAFDCISHELLIAKLDAYGVEYNSLYVIYSYLSNIYQRVNVNAEYSSWSEINFGVFQGLILGPWLFNIYLSDLFLLLIDSNVANYSDDNISYTTARNTELVINKLENDSKTLFQLINFLKAIPEKSHLLLNNTDTSLFALIDSHIINNSEQVKLLGITIDNELTFDEHVSKLFKKTRQNVHALSRVCHYMIINKRRTIMKAFIESHFGYYPLVWMLHSRTLNTHINRIHERALRLVYNDYISTFSELLKLDNSFTVHERNIQTLAIEVLKLVHNLSPEIMSEVFILKSSQKLFKANISDQKCTHNI